MKLKKITLLFIIVVFTSCAQESSRDLYKSEDLVIQKISNHTFLHISYLDTEEYGRVPCNGALFIKEGEAIVLDTPANKEASVELIQWIEDENKASIKGVIATHFHEDCLGGLTTFHDKAIPSYANRQTLSLAKSRGFSLPQNGFDENLELIIGNQKVMTVFLGEGHTSDNIVCYIPSEKVLFGGCLIKAIGAGKGNLDDANVDEWSETVKKVKARFAEAEYVIPGHGKMGGVELLDYTIEKFAED